MLLRTALNASSLNGPATPAVLLASLACGASTSAQGVGTPIRRASARASATALGVAQGSVTRAFALPAFATLPQARARLRALPTHTKAVRAEAFARGRLIAIQFRAVSGRASASARAAADALPNAMLGTSSAAAQASAVIARPDRRVFTTARATTAGRLDAFGTARLDLRARALLAAVAFVEPSTKSSGSSHWDHSAVLRVPLRSAAVLAKPQFLVRQVAAGRSLFTAVANLRRPGRAVTSVAGRVSFTDQVLLIPPGGLWRSESAAVAVGTRVKVPGAEAVSVSRLRVRSSARILGTAQGAAVAMVATVPTHRLAATLVRPCLALTVDASATRVVLAPEFIQGAAQVDTAGAFVTQDAYALAASAAVVTPNESRVMEVSAAGAMLSASSLDAPLLAATGSVDARSAAACDTTTEIVHHELAQASVSTALSLAASAARTCLAVGEVFAGSAVIADLLFLIESSPASASLAAAEPWCIFSGEAEGATTHAIDATPTRITFDSGDVTGASTLFAGGVRTVYADGSLALTTTAQLTEPVFLAGVNGTAAVTSAATSLRTVFAAAEGLSTGAIAETATRVAFGGGAVHVASAVSGVATRATCGASQAALSATAALQEPIYLSDAAMTSAATLGSQTTRTTWTSANFLGASSVSADATRVLLAHISIEYEPVAPPSAINGGMFNSGGFVGSARQIPTAAASFTGEVDRRALIGLTAPMRATLTLAEAEFLGHNAWVFCHAELTASPTRTFGDPVFAHAQSSISADATRVVPIHTVSSQATTSSVTVIALRTALPAAAALLTARAGVSEPIYLSGATAVANSSASADAWRVSEFGSIAASRSSVGADATRTTQPAKTLSSAAICQPTATRTCDAAASLSVTVSPEPVPAETRVGQMTLRLVASSAQARGVISRGLLDPEQRTFYRPATTTEFRRPGTLALRRAA